MTGIAPGAEPRGVPAARWLAVLVGAALLGLAGVAARDLWIHFTSEAGTSWIGTALRWAATTQVDPLTVAAGMALSVLGLTLLVAAVTPRPHTHVRYSTETSIWLRPVDIARKATYTVREETGAGPIRSQASRTRLRIQAQDDGRGTLLQERVHSAVQSQFQGLRRPPSVDVRLTPAPETQKEL